LFLFVIVLLASTAHAQKDDWRAVQHLGGGTKLKIKLKHGRTFGNCEFMGATDDELICGYDGFLREDQRHFSHDNIKAIYLVHNARAIGFGIGAGTGIVLGAAVAGGPAVKRELYAVIDGSILGGFGYFVGMVLDPFVHGRAIYVDSKARRGRSTRPIATDRQ